MRLLSFVMPDGWPISLWFLIATAVVYLLQRFPLTGIFLMFLLAPFWSIVLVNLGVIGIGLEALFGRVSRLWLIVPLLYFGLYYLAYARDQATLAMLRQRYSQHNAGKALAFDPSRQDLVIEKGKGDLHPTPFEFVRRFGLKRVFDAELGRVHFMGDADACALLRGNEVYRSAGIYSFGFFADGGAIGSRKSVKGYCSIYAPDRPDKTVVRVRSDDFSESAWGLPVRKQELRIHDEAAGSAFELWSGSAGTLKPFPMPFMGCGLNSGAARWECSHGWMRDRVAILEPGKRYSDNVAAIAAALGLQPSDDFAAIATGPERLKAIGDAADRELVAKELAVLERILANPLEDVRDSWFRHLPSRPDAVEPFAERMFAALGTLQHSDLGGSNNGGSLWRLAAVLPEQSLAPHRQQLTEWLRPENARRWTTSQDAIYTRLDVADPAQREIVLHRLETEKGDLKIDLLPPFCRMGAAAPDEVKERLLGVWRARALDRSGKVQDRSQNDVMLYLTLARMGLKQAAGKVEQRYYGPTFLAIWEQVTPETPEDICSDNLNDVVNRFRR